MFSFNRPHLPHTPIFLHTAGRRAAVPVQPAEGLLTAGPWGGLLPGPQLCSGGAAVAHGRGGGLQHAQVSHVRHGASQAVPSWHDHTTGTTDSTSKGYHMLFHLYLYLTCNRWYIHAHTWHSTCYSFFFPLLDSDVSVISAAPWLPQRAV